MSDSFTKEKRSQIMAAVRSKGNKTTEMTLIKIFRKHGVNGWRRHAPLVGCPDFVFREERLAVFVDGCFWNGCPKHLRNPKGNRHYWRRKIQRNRKRDVFVTRTLRRAGWFVLRVWEHELRGESQLVARVWKLRSCRNSVFYEAYHEQLRQVCF
jgi:DNA mismatch endonuclease, patch repair protein